MKKRPIVLIAGWAHTERALEPLASALQAGAYNIKVESTWRLLRRMECATRQGSGPNPCRFAQGEDLAQKPPVKEDPDLSCYAKGLRQILEQQDTPSVVVGWSAGGMVALEVACKNPELLERLVLVGATAKLCADDGYPCGVAARNVRAMTVDIRKNPRTVLDRFFQDVSWPAVEPEPFRNEKAKEAHDMGIEALVHGLRYLQKTDLRDRLKKVKIPTLIIHGRQDRIVPWQAGAWLSHSLPDSRFVIHEEVGHDIAERKSSALVPEIREFLEDQC